MCRALRFKRYNQRGAMEQGSVFLSNMSKLLVTILVLSNVENSGENEDTVSSATTPAKSLNEQKKH